MWSIQCRCIGQHSHVTQDLPSALGRLGLVDCLWIPSALSKCCCPKRILSYLIPYHPLLFLCPSHHPELKVQLSIPCGHTHRPFECILEAFAAEAHYTIGQFLFEFFCPALPGSYAAGRSEYHGKMLGAFLRARGTGSYWEILRRLDAVAGYHEVFSSRPDETPRYSIGRPHKFDTSTGVSIGRTA